MANKSGAKKSAKRKRVFDVTKKAGRKAPTGSGKRKSPSKATRKGAVKKEARRKMAPSAPLRSAEKRKKKSS